MSEQIKCLYSRFIICLLLFPSILCLFCTKNNSDLLQKQFSNPSSEHQMRVFWWWLESNISKSGISRDLDEMKKKGIGGALLYDGGSSSYTVAKRTPAGPDYFSPEWRELYRYALKEAKRLGLEITLNAGGSGWNIGGPWVTPEFAAQKIVFSETRVQGPLHFQNMLPLPNGVLRDSLDKIIYYRDVAILAYRTQNSPSPIRPPIENWEIQTVNRLPREGTIWASLMDIGPGNPDDVDVLADSLVDLSDGMREDGFLDWTFPPGEWIVLRFGHTITGKRQSTPSPGGEGLMIDPLNPLAMDMHFNTILDTLIKDADGLIGNTLTYFFIDSWEEGAVNWTANFPAEFSKRRGYDIRPFLPVLAGKIVKNREITNRFLYDFRRTIGDCVADYYYGRFQNLSHEHGILCNPEAGGPHPAPLDALQCLGRTDVPTGEFWARAQTHRVEDWRRIFVKQSASAAHIYGKKLVAMEAFTTLGPHWEKDPWDLKPTADRAFCEGANQFYKVIFTHSPIEVGKPGYEFFAGTHFNPNITWWEQATAWTKYIARCQWMLKQGLFVGDVCYYYGDNVPNFVPLKHIDPSLGPGYDYDVVNSEVILNRMSVTCGRIILPDGMSYGMMVLPDRESIPLAVLKKIDHLVRAGATIVGPKPTKATGLQDYPSCDVSVSEIANSLWGPCDGIKVKENFVQQGRVIWGKSLRQILLDNGVLPDFEYQSHFAGAFLDYIHRQEENLDIYFVVNRNEHWEEAECLFRVSDKTPELWFPDTGEIQQQQLFSVDQKQIKIPLRLPPFGSVFVVFKPSRDQVHFTSFEKNGQPVIAGNQVQVGDWPSAELMTSNQGNIELLAWEPGTYELMDSKKGLRKIDVQSIPNVLLLDGSWQVSFNQEWGGPASVIFEDLHSWTESPDPGLKYYSGSAIYQQKFDIDGQLLNPNHLFLDLGKVKNIARVNLNGKDLGILWKKPFRLDITSIVKKGTNTIEIEITNLWPNRLIGDQFLPEENRFTHTNVQKFTRESSLLESGLLGPVTIHFAHTVKL